MYVRATTYIYIVEVKVTDIKYYTFLCLLYVVVYICLCEIRVCTVRYHHVYIFLHIKLGLTSLLYHINIQSAQKKWHKQDPRGMYWGNHFFNVANKFDYYTLIYIYTYTIHIYILVHMYDTEAEYIYLNL